MNAHSPPNKPDRKNLFCGRKDDGRRCCNRQMDDQLVPIAMVINVVVRNSRFNNAGTAFAGLHSRYPKSKLKDGEGSGGVTVVE